MELLTALNETCRLCCTGRSEGCDMISLFGKKDGRTLAAKVTELTGIKIDPQDGLPPVACMKCSEQVNTVVNFIENCRISNKILTHLFQNYHNGLSTSHRAEASVTQQIQHGSNIIKTVLLVSSASDLNDRMPSSATVPTILVSQHSDIKFSKPADVTPVTNSPNILKPVISVANLHESRAPSCQMAQISTSVGDRIHGNEKQNNRFESSHNAGVSLLPSPYSIIHQSVPTNSNNLHHTLEDRSSSSSSSGSIPSTKENSHSTTGVQHTFETDPSKNAQEKCQAVLAEQTLYSNVVGCAATVTSKMNSSVLPVNSNIRHFVTVPVIKSHTTVSQILDRTHECGTDIYNKESTIQKPHSHNLTHVGKSLSNAEIYTQICSSENKECQVSIQDGLNRSVYNPRSNVVQKKCTLPLPAQNANDTVTIATVPLKDKICHTKAVENATLSSVKVTSLSDITTLHNSGAPCRQPPPPLVPLTESQKRSHSVHSFVPKTVGPVTNVKNRNSHPVSGLDHSHDKVCSSAEKGISLERDIPSRTSITATYISEENRSLAKHVTHTLHSSIITTKSLSRGKPTSSDIPASTSKVLLNPSEVSEVVRAIGSELGVFLENDDNVGNISQASEYSASGPRVSTEYNNPQTTRNFATSDQATGPTVLQLQPSFPTLQHLSPNMPSSYIHKAPDSVDKDHQRILSRCVTPVNERRKRLTEGKDSARPKLKKYGPQNKSCASRQRKKETKFGYLMEDTVKSLLASIKAAFPDMKIPTQEELQNIVINSNQTKQRGVSEVQGFRMLKTKKKSGKELLSTEASGIEEEAQKRDTFPEELAVENSTEKLNKLRSFRIKITKTNGKYRSSSPQTYSKLIHQDAQDLSAPENRQEQNVTCEYRTSEVKLCEQTPVVTVKRLNKFFVPGVTYRLTDVNVSNLLHTKK